MKQGEILLRVPLHNQEQARAALKNQALPFVGEQLKAGRELMLQVGLLEDDISARQRAYFHAVVLEEFHLYARPNGQQFPRETWKIFLKERFIGFKTVTAIDPMTGAKRRLRYRISSEELGVRGYADLIDKCIAFAASECGFEVSEPLPPELRGQRKRQRAVEEGNVDAETGEVLEHA